VERGLRRIPLRRVRWALLSGAWSYVLWGLQTIQITRGDYKQYMDYSKYTQGQGAQGGSDYKKYMDYSKYTQGAKANDANSESPALLAAPKSSDEGSFVRDYKNYMQQRGKNVSAGFEKYMKTHAGEFKHYVQSRGAEAAGDFDDYFKNYKSFFQNEGKDAAGDFQKFVNEYASDYAKYLKERGGNAAADYKKYQTRYQEGGAAVVLASTGGDQSAAPDQQSAEEKKESQEREEEKQRLREELQSEHERLRKELQAEKEHLRKELAEEAKEHQQSPKSGAAPAMLMQKVATYWFFTPLLAVVAGAGAVFAFLRRQAQRRRSVMDDYVNAVRSKSSIAEYLLGLQWLTEGGQMASAS